VRRAVDGVGRHARLGGTLDDATGEAFDKVAKLLGLGWPWAGAGAAVGRRRSAAICVSRGRCWGGPGADFSFSGLKTAVAREVARHGTGALPVQIAADIAASFQRAAAEVLADRAAHAMAMMRERSRDAHVLVIAGGVAANSAIRSALAEGASEQGFELVAPPVRLCTDNAVMVAWTGIERLRLGMSDGLEFAPRPRWPL
jgi:N6-L-threonylcarbamoyladenine synthase